jgi:hypothetical protein
VRVCDAHGLTNGSFLQPDMDNIRRYGTYAYSTGGEFTGHWQVGKVRIPSEFLLR